MSTTVDGPMTARAFRDDGFLQEVNRQFFHPLGLALALHVDDVEGPVRLSLMETDDVEGFEFGWDTAEALVAARVKAEKVEFALDLRKSPRMTRFGAVVQPLCLTTTRDV